MEKVENMGMPMPEDFKVVKKTEGTSFHIKFSEHQTFEIVMADHMCTREFDLFSWDELKAFFMGLEACTEFNLFENRDLVVDTEAWDQACQKWAQKQMAKK